MLGSECMYHIENSIIDHVTNSATGTNIIVGIMLVMKAHILSLNVT